MHHIGLPRSPFQQRQHPLSPSAIKFPFSSPSRTYSATIFSTPAPLPQAAITDAAAVTAASLQDFMQSQDNRDVLLERLHDLIDKLEDDDNALADEAVSRIHGEVDKIEGFVSEGVKKRDVDDDLDVEYVEGGNGRERMTLAEVKRSEEDSYSAGLSPGVLRKVRERVERQRREKGKRRAENGGDSRAESRSSRWGHDSQVAEAEDGYEDNEEGEQEASMTPTQLTAITTAASDLAAKLATTLAELQARKAESDEIHDLLVRRCEASTERILLLEYRIAEMEDDFSVNASELSFLRIQLQAIEAQCAPYVAMGKEDDGGELSECIANWRIDWEEVDRRMRARRGREKDIASGGGDGRLLRPDGLTREVSGEVPLRKSFSHFGEHVGVGP